MVEDDVKMTQVEEVATAVAGSIPIKRKYGEKISPGFVQKIQKIRIGWYPRFFHKSLHTLRDSLGCRPPPMPTKPTVLSPKP